MSNLPVRLNLSERKTLAALSERLGLIYKSRPSIGQILHYIAAGEALVMLHAYDDAAEMHSAASDLRDLLARMTAQDYTKFEQILSGLAAALDSAAGIRAEFECAEQDEDRED